MQNGLVRRIGLKLILPLAFAGIVGSGCSKTYVIDGNQVKDRGTSHNTLIENRGDSLEIKYSIPFWKDVSSKTHLKKIKVNGVKYNEEDLVVYEAGDKRYFYLLSKIDSIDNAEEEARKQEKFKLIYKRDSTNYAEKEAKRQAKINHGLKAFE